jgi:hypothetical protein
VRVGEEEEQQQGEVDNMEKTYVNQPAEEEGPHTMAVRIVSVAHL